MKNKIYDPKEVKISWEQVIHEQTCATMLYNVPRDIVVRKEDFPAFVKQIPQTIGDCTEFYDEDNKFVGRLCWRSGQWGIPNPEYVEPKCNCTPRIEPIDLSGGWAEDDFLDIKPKEEK